MEPSTELRQVMDRAADIANPQRRHYWCESRRLYILAGVLLLVGGLIGMAGTTSEVSYKCTDSVEARHRRRTAMSMLFFALFIAAAGAVLISKGYCVKKML
jgi:predicted nucleic acid-binding Zn ribbon protein